MAYHKGHRKGGSGGKLGHSNMSHWDESNVIKLHAKKVRRLEEREMEQSVTVNYDGDKEQLYQIDENHPLKGKSRNKPAIKKQVSSFMSSRQLDELITILRKDRMQYYYFRDYYAFQLLSYLAEDNETDIRQIKSSSFARLLNKPIIKKITGKISDGLLTKEILQYNMPLAQECFVLTLGEWGDERNRWWANFNQTSRPGKNLVLQLNFSNKHDKLYRRLIDPKGENPFEYEYHPIASGKRRTLAWARIDIADDYSYALIEEIQTDWIRVAKEAQVNKTVARVDEYLDNILKPYETIWDEAMLSATIWLLKEEIGIKTIFYHTFEGGNLLKGIDHTKKPPRSLYTTLPKKFCFELTDRSPAFLEERILQLKEKTKKRVGFYILQF
jgi:hypothetical protein